MVLKTFMCFKFNAEFYLPKYIISGHVQGFIFETATLGIDTHGGNGNKLLPYLAWKFLSMDESLSSCKLKLLLIMPWFWKECTIGKEI